ncbi:MAG: 3'(2'),5'-bisphosphate nucleotidase CysQ [Acidimicrobiia bacterium]|nr:3'(2'),5'-bisphosphate nucleotidase CysQ [Acidimicrobiia bacterium]
MGEHSVPLHPAATAADHRQAGELALEAGRLLVELRAEQSAAGTDPKQMKDAGDNRSNELLLERLEPNVAAGDAVLSEEARDDLGRLDHERVWIIDPLDGTREFGEVPRTDWAVHVALTIDGQPAAGAVALPALEVVFTTSPAPTVPAPSGGRPRLVVSRTRPPAAATFLAERLDGDLVEMGSAGAKAMAILRGDVDVYAHSGGQYEWDSCAPVAVALAAGLHASRIDGSPLRYNNADPYLPDLLICRPELADAALGALAAFDE